MQLGKVRAAFNHPATKGVLLFLAVLAVMWLIWHPETLEGFLNR